jgi:hypothetical protein
VNYRLSFRIFLVVLVSLAIFWAAPAAARLYPPCQDISHAWVGDLVTIRYWVTDPISGQTKEETWSLTQGAAHSIESVQVDQGILTWIAKYRGWGEVDYTYEVHYRIYDPGLGVWKAGSWGPFNGYSTWLGQHQVKDGVIAWTANRTLGSSPTDQLEHRVLYATYDPDLGSWTLGEDLWQVDSTSKYSPEVLRVKNGVVAWPMNDSLSGKSSDERHVDIYFTIYDQENHQWRSRKWDTNWAGDGFDWINIVNDTVIIEKQYWYDYSHHHSYVAYDPYTNDWFNSFSDYDTCIRRRAFFVAQPSSGVIPFQVCFWDCSTALDGVPNHSDWYWDLAPSIHSYLRSFIFPYTDPGQHTVTERVFYNGAPTFWSATGQISALAPAAPTGGISINNGAAYTRSANVTLSLNYGSSATQMCIQQSPGLNVLLWEPVAPSKQWTLSAYGGTPEGSYTVWVKYRDQNGTESPEYQASIILDVTPPAVFLTLNNGDATTCNPAVRVSYSASDAIGLTKMSYATLNQGDSKYIWIHVDLPSLLTYYPHPSTIKFSSKPGRKTVMVRFTDVAGNVTHTQASILLKAAALPFLPLLLGD